MVGDVDRLDVVDEVGGVVVLVEGGVGAGIWNTTSADADGVDDPDGGLTVTVKVTGVPWGGIKGPSAVMV